MITLETSGKIPHWLNSKTRTRIHALIQECLPAHATGKGVIIYQIDAKVFNRQLPANSLTLVPGKTHSPNTVRLIGTGKDPSTDIAEFCLTTTLGNVEQIVRHLSTKPKDSPSSSTTAERSETDNGTLPAGGGAASSNTPVYRPALLPAPSAPTFDEDTFALFLDAVRDAGGTITTSTAQSLARKLTGDTAIVTASLQADYLDTLTPLSAGLYGITAAGMALLARIIDLPKTAAGDSTKPAPSEFERLKASLIAARAQHQAAKAAHDVRAQARTALTHQLTEAREALQSEELNATTLQGRLQKLQQDITSAQCKVTGARRHVLDLEEQSRALGTDTPDLIQAERTLKEAEAAYQQLIAL